MAKITEYPEALSFDEGDVILKDGVNGTKKMTVEKLMENLASPVDATLTQEGKPADAKAAGDAIAGLKSAMAHQYDSASTYVVGQIVLYDNALYRCVSVIDTPEEWTAAHWSQIYVGDELRQLHIQVNTLELLEKGRGFTPEQLQEICADGVAEDYFSVGDIIYIPWTDYVPITPVTYSVPHVVTHFGDVEDENGVVHENAMWLMWIYATPNVVQFDHPEAIVATESVFSSDYHYYIKSGDDYVEQPDVVIGTSIPAGETYYHHVRTGVAGRLRYGSNDWTQSAYRAYLNSDAEKGQWWTAQHDSDVAPNEADTVPGFRKGYETAWNAIFKPIKVVTALNTVCDEGRDAVTYDTFFLPSLEQMYGVPQKDGIEGDVWEYWIEETGLPSRSNGSSSNVNDARKIPTVTDPTGSAVSCRLRSATRATTSAVWSVATAGYLNTYNATNSYRAQPACVIY